jgi:outer membrane protein TolC
MREAAVIVLAVLLSVQLASAQAAPIKRVALQEAITLAVARAPQAEQAQAEIRRAEALVGEARATSFPTLVGNGTYTHLDHDRQLNGRTVAGQNQLNANLVLAVPLLAPSRWANRSHASDYVGVARLAADDVRRQVTIAVAQAYLAVIAQHRNAEVTQRAVDTAKAHYDYAHTRYTGGVGNKLDDVRAGQEVATSEAQRAAAGAGLVRAQEALGVLLGEDAPVDAEDTVNLPEAPTLAQGLTQATTERSDVRASEARVSAAKTVVDDAWLDYVPLLVGQVQPFYTNPATISQPSLTVAFYDGGYSSAKHDEQHAAVAASRAQYTALIRQAKSEVRLAFAVVERADAALAAANQAAQLAGQALEMATLAYKAGATSDLEVIDAERRARDAETAAVIAEDNARRARVDLLAATGKLP